MQNKTLGFIGGGRITKIFLQAFANKDQRFKAVVVYDINSEVLSGLSSQFQDIQTSDDLLLTAKQDIVFIALHPPAIMDTLELIKEVVSDKTIIVSLAPKISSGKLHQKLDTPNIIRMIPSATSFINEGYNPVCFSEQFDLERELVSGLFEVLGTTFEVAEEQLEAYAIISAMLPTYFWFQFKSLAALGTQMGLTNEQANEAIYHTMIAAMNTLYRSGKSADEVIDLIPVKPIGGYEAQVNMIYEGTLLSLYNKIKP
jgi:pyrroline-5-carboxylate reductase